MSEKLINLNILFLLFIIAIISSFKSSLATIFFFDNLRLVLAVIASFLIIISLHTNRISKRILFQIILLFFLITYGILLNFINIKNIYLHINIHDIFFLFFSFIITFFLLRVITYYKDFDNCNNIILIIFLILSFIFFFLNGYNFKELNFNFEIGQLDYSLGLTFVFFLAFFTSFYLLKETNSRIKPAKTILYLLTSLFFLFFALSSGGRGESIFGFLIILFMFVNFIKKNWILSLVFLLLAVLLIVMNYDNLIIIKRLSLLFYDGQYGSRPELIVMSLNLLYNEPKCLLFGCGFNFFQDYYSIDKKLYPHNIILEFVITYGLLISIYIFTFVFIGLKSILFRQSKILLIDIFLIFCFLSLNKSGSLFSFFNFPVIFYFFYKSNFNFHRKFKFKKY